MAQLLGKIVGQFLTKLNILQPYHSATALLGIYPQELKMYVYTKLYKIFIAALFIIAKTLKLPRYK
jgi:hypothetical protein